MMKLSVFHVAVIILISGQLGHGQNVLEDERDRQSIVHRDLEDCLKDYTDTYANASASLKNLIADIKGLIGKDGASVKCQCAIGILLRTLAEDEKYYEAEIFRLLKEYETDTHDLRLDLYAVEKENDEYLEVTKFLGQRIEELKMALKDSERARDEAQQAQETIRKKFDILESQFLELELELEEIRESLKNETTRRKKAEEELEEAKLTIIALRNPSKR